MRVIVTGSRTLADDRMVKAVLDGLYRRSRDTVTVVNGGCSRGADRLAQSWADRKQIVASEVENEIHPADWKQLGKAAGPIRNQEMADAGADLCVAFVDKPLETSKGTADMVRRARAAGIPVYVIQAMGAE